MIPSSYDRLPQASQSDGELLQLFPFFTYYSFQYQISPEQLPFFFWHFYFASEFLHVSTSKL